MDKKMHRHVLTALFMFMIATPVLGADEKIDPETYICAELVAASVDGVPPIYEGLQLDGYVAAKNNLPVADPEALAPLLIAVSDSCTAKPGDKAIEHWKEIRENIVLQDEGSWRSDKTTCGDYYADEENGSGFIIWADAYNRGKTGKKESILKDQATFDHFLEVCKSSPGKLVIDVIAENAK